MCFEGVFFVYCDVGGAGVALGEGCTSAERSGLLSVACCLFCFRFAKGVEVALRASSMGAGLSVREQRAHTNPVGAF